MLRDAGCDVRVFERSPTALTARGAGIAVLDSTLKYLVERGGLPAEDVCLSTNWIRFLHRDGSVRHEQPHRYRFSSWNTIYRSLLGIFGTDRYQLDAEVTDFSQHGDRGNSPSVMTCWPVAAPSATARNSSARSAPVTRASSSGSTPLVTSSEGPRSAMGIQPLAIERCSDLAEPLCAQLESVRELVASIPAPRRDHRQHEDPVRDGLS